MFWNAIPDDERSLKASLPSEGQVLTREECGDLACMVALGGAGAVGRNPMVGAVAVDEHHRFVGAGAHLQDGQAHAEANLVSGLKMRGFSEEQLKRLTVYCTLEPCSFAGRTPSCAALLAGIPMRKLVFAMEDSHKKVRGSGIHLLSQKGVECEFAPGLFPSAPFLAERSLWYHLCKIPFVGLKAAVSLDGSYALKSGERYRITGARALAYGHWLRQVYDGILVGAGTMIADNPTLDVRVPVPRETKNPVPVILDPEGQALTARLPAEQLVLKIPGRRCLWFVKRGALLSPESEKAARLLGDLGAEILVLPEGPEAVPELLKILGEKGLTSLLLEGGAGIWSSFLMKEAVQRMHVFSSLRLAGEDGLTWTSGLKKQIPGPDQGGVRISPLEEDILIEYRTKSVLPSGNNNPH